MFKEYLPSNDATFGLRQQAVVDTANYHGLGTDHILIQSGAAFALHGLDTRVDQLASGPFDIDALFDTDDQKTGEVYKRLYGHYFAGTPQVPRDLQYPTVPVGPHELKREYWFRALGADHDIALITHTTGLQIPDVATLVRSKAKVGRSKDVVGLLQSYLLAPQTNETHSINPVWKEVMPSILSSIELRTTRGMNLDGLPWLSALVQRQFQVDELTELI